MDDKSDDILKDGVLVVTLSSWQEFHIHVQNLRSERGFVWRGQKRDEEGGWFLQSKFDRELQTEKQHDRDDRLKLHLQNFKEAMNNSYPNVLPKDDVDIWALGQHYGLKTPLLDWTLSPFIAAYFAFNYNVDQGDQNDHYRFVYALNRSLERLITKQKKSSQILSSGRSVPFIDQLPYPNPRFIAQKGIFTKAFHGKDIGNYVQSFSRKRPNEIILVKFKIPTRDRESCLYELHMMNIDHVSLLLDLSDAVNYCNSKI